MWSSWVTSTWRPCERRDTHTLFGFIHAGWTEQASVWHGQPKLWCSDCKQKLLKNQTHVVLTVICVVCLGSVTQSWAPAAPAELAPSIRMWLRGKPTDKKQVWFSLTGFPRKLEGSQVTLRAGRRESGTFHSFRSTRIYFLIKGYFHHLEPNWTTSARGLFGRGEGAALWWTEVPFKRGKIRVL